MKPTADQTPGPITGPETGRDHALDSLRGFAMFLGILLHAGISFTTRPPSFWPVRDDDPSPLFDVCLLAVHDFRMQLFFLLAGFFGCLLYRRYGAGGMLRHRLKRVAVPFVLALVLVIPTVQAAMLYTEIENVQAVTVRGEASTVREYAAGLVAANPDASSAQLTLNFFTSGAFLSRLLPAHLWFLYFLLIFYAAVLLLAPLFGRLSGTPLLASFDERFRRLILGRWRLLFPALFTVLLMLPMRWVVDTPGSWLPPPHVLGYYFWFFAVGWLLYRHRDLTADFGRSWRTNLAVANLVVLPAVLVLVIGGATKQERGEDVTGYWLGGSVASAAYTWLMIGGLWGLFLHYFSQPRAWVRYMADASYWCYLMSITPVLVLQFWVQGWAVPGPLKFLLVVAITMAGLLASYEWCVRYTVIGAVLNGRKRRSDALSSSGSERARSPDTDERSASARVAEPTSALTPRR